MQFPRVFVGLVTGGRTIFGLFSGGLSLFSGGLGLLQGGIDVAMGGGISALCGGQSFTGGTKVLLASGAAIPIADLKPGDKVLATNVKTGKTQAETVAAVMVHHDKNLYDLKIKTGARVTVIHTTTTHLFWDTYLDKWVPTNKLSKNEHLKAPNGTTVTVVSGTTPKQHSGWMWDLTVPGNNDHDFYVIAGQSPEVPVLVHNSDPECGPAYENPGHHDPSGGPNPYNPNKAVLPADAEAQFANSIEIDGARWTKIGSGRNAVYYRYFDTGNDTWHFSGSSNGVTRSGANVGIPLNRIPIEIRRLP